MNEIRIISDNREEQQDRSEGTGSDPGSGRDRCGK